MRVLLVLMLILLASPASAATRVEGVRIWPAPDHTRLVLDTAEAAEHNLFSLSGPARLVMDLKDTTLQADFGELDL